jgi:hypothetical protein
VYPPPVMFFLISISSPSRRYLTERTAKFLGFGRFVPSSGDVLTAGDVQRSQAGQGSQGEEGPVQQTQAVVEAEVRQPHQAREPRQRVPHPVDDVSTALQIQIPKRRQACTRVWHVNTYIDNIHNLLDWQSKLILI